MKHLTPHQELENAKSYEKYLEDLVKENSNSINNRMLTKQRELVKLLVERIINIENSLIVNGD